MQPCYVISSKPLDNPGACLRICGSVILVPIGRPQTSDLNGAVHSSSDFLRFLPSLVDWRSLRQKPTTGEENGIPVQSRRSQMLQHYLRFQIELPLDVLCIPA